MVLFQNWFSAAAEEASVASRVTVYLREVKKATPSLLAFLINLADDNGNTVLHYSVSHCNYSIVSLLLDTGALLNRMEYLIKRDINLMVNKDLCLVSATQVWVMLTYRTRPATQQ